MVKRSSASLRKSARDLLKRAKMAEKKEKKDKAKKEKKARSKRAAAARHRVQTRRRASVRKAVKDHRRESVDQRRRLRSRNATKRRGDKNQSHRSDVVRASNSNPDVLDIVIMGHGLSPNNESSTGPGHLSVSGVLPGWANIRGMNSAHLTDTTDESWETDWYNCAIPGHNAYGVTGGDTVTDGEILTEAVSDLRKKGLTQGTTVEIAEGINSGMKDSFHALNTKPYGASKSNVLCFLYEPDSEYSAPDPETGHPGSSDIQHHNWAGIYNVQFKPSSANSRGALIHSMAQDPKCNVTADVLNKLSEDDPAYMGWHDNHTKPGGRGYVFPSGDAMTIPLIRIEEALVALHPHVKRINFYSHLCLGRWDGEKVLGVSEGGVGFGNTDRLKNDINYNISESLAAMSTDEKRIFPKGSTAVTGEEDKIHIRQDELSRFQADKEQRGTMIPETIAEIAGSEGSEGSDDDEEDVRMRSI